MMNRCMLVLVIASLLLLDSTGFVVTPRPAQVVTPPTTQLHLNLKDILLPSRRRKKNSRRRRSDTTASDNAKTVQRIDVASSPSESQTVSARPTPISSSPTLMKPLQSESLSTPEPSAVSSARDPNVWVRSKRLEESNGPRAHKMNYQTTTTSSTRESVQERIQRVQSGMLTPEETQQYIQTALQKRPGSFRDPLMNPGGDDSDRSDDGTAVADDESGDIIDNSNGKRSSDKSMINSGGTLDADDDPTIRSSSIDDSLSSSATRTTRPASLISPDSMQRRRLLNDAEQKKREWFKKATKPFNLETPPATEKDISSSSSSWEPITFAMGMESDEKSTPVVMMNSKTSSNDDSSSNDSKISSGNSNEILKAQETYWANQVAATTSTNTAVVNDKKKAVSSITNDSLMDSMNVHEIAKQYDTNTNNTSMINGSMISNAPAATVTPPSNAPAAAADTIPKDKKPIRMSLNLALDDDDAPNDVVERYNSVEPPSDDVDAKAKQQAKQWGIDLSTI